MPGLKPHVAAHSPRELNTKLAHIVRRVGLLSILATRHITSILQNFSRSLSDLNSKYRSSLNLFLSHVMPIAALSKDASDSIASTLVLNDAISVVKELVDNALDSHATNIVIEISANTLDVIQVKDNGAGIGVEDRQLLCRRGYTSKIRTLEDLAQLGGTFLGFRGEALASIAALSECLIFVTRVDGETVGTRLEFDSNCKLTK